MNTAISFHGITALDFEELRKNAIRIPQVLTRVRQAQELWDKAGLPSFDFLNYLSSDDDRFLANIKFKSLATAVVQLGLYDRYLDKNKMPTYLVGDVSKDAALLVATGRKTMAEMVSQSAAALSMAEEDSVSSLLAGVSAESLSVYKMNPENEEDLFEKMDIENKGLEGIIRQLVDDEEVRQFVNVGPGSNFENIRAKMAMEEIRFCESIDDDPMLNWFYESMWQGEYKVAQ